ncbi:MAG: cohesin domain-containing protein [Candidatus Shapirobacteria bacterium]
MRLIKIICFFFLFVFIGRPVEAQAGAKLLLEPQTGSASPVLTVKVNIDPSGIDIKSADANLTFDPAKIEITNVALGSYFDDPYQYLNNTQGILNLGGSFNDAFQATAATGTLATLNLRAKITGTGTLNFTCTAGETNDSNIHNIGNQDIIDCTATLANNGTYTLAGSGTNPTATLTPTLTPTATGGSQPTPASTTTPTPTSPLGATDLPVTGTRENTLALLGLGMVILLGGIWGIKFF